MNSCTSVFVCLFSSLLWLKKRVERKVPAILKPSSKVDKVRGTFLFVCRGSSPLRQFDCACKHMLGNTVMRWGKADFTWTSLGSSDVSYQQQCINKFEFIRCQLSATLHQ